jgi:hypothetical protein
MSGGGLYNPSTWESEGGKFKANLGYITRPCHNPPLPKEEFEYLF